MGFGFLFDPIRNTFLIEWLLSMILIFFNLYFIWSHSKFSTYFSTPTVSDGILSIRVVKQDTGYEIHKITVYIFWPVQMKGVPDEKGTERESLR